MNDDWDKDLEPKYPGFYTLEKRDRRWSQPRESRPSTRTPSREKCAKSREPVKRAREPRLHLGGAADQPALFLGAPIECANPITSGLELREAKHVERQNPLEVGKWNRRNIGVVSDSVSMVNEHSRCSLSQR